MNAKQTPQYVPADSWIVDSGAYHHMTADMTGLSQVMPFEGSEKIIIGNGTNFPIKSVGTTTINTDTHSLVLKHVLHVPQIARSLLSVKQLFDDNKSWFICDETNFFLFGTRGQRRYCTKERVGQESCFIFQFSRSTSVYSL